MLRFEIAMESTAAETIGAAYGFAALWLFVSKASGVVWRALRARWVAPSGSPATLPA